MFTAVLLAPAVASAATILVTTTADDVTPNGTCSLREAIQAANGDVAVDACPAGSGADVIRLDNGVYRLTIPGANEDAALTGDLDITSDIPILSARAQSQTSSIAAPDDVHVFDRVIDVHPGVTVTLEDVTERGGLLSSDDAEASGGGIRTRAAWLTLARIPIAENVVFVGVQCGPPGEVGFPGRGGGLSVEVGSTQSVVAPTGRAGRSTTAARSGSNRARWGARWRPGNASSRRRDPGDRQR